MTIGLSCLLYHTNDSSNYFVNDVLNHPIDKVWEVVAIGFGNVSKYNPGIKASKFDSEKKYGVGTKRHCEFDPKGYVKEEIIDWKEMNSFKLKFIESSFPMAIVESEFIFEENNGKTILKQNLWYRMKFPMGWMSGLMKSKMKISLEQGLKGLEQYLNN